MGSKNLPPLPPELLEQLQRAADDGEEFTVWFTFEGVQLVDVGPSRAARRAAERRSGRRRGFTSKR